MDEVKFALDTFYASIMENQKKATRALAGGGKSLPIYFPKLKIKIIWKEWHWKIHTV